MSRELFDGGSRGGLHFPYRFDEDLEAIQDDRASFPRSGPKCALNGVEIEAAEPRPLGGWWRDIAKPAPERQARLDAVWARMDERMARERAEKVK